MASLVGAVGVLGIAWIPPQAPFVLLVGAVVLAGGCAIGWNGVWITMVAEAAPPRLQARSIATGLTINQPAILLGPWLFGSFVDSTGSYQLAWTALGLLLLLSAWLISRAQEPANPPCPVQRPCLDEAGLPHKTGGQSAMPRSPRSDPVGRGAKVSFHGPEAILWRAANRAVQMAESLLVGVKNGVRKR